MEEGSDGEKVLLLAIIGKCYFCGRVDVEGREQVVKKYEHRKRKNKVTSEIKALMCRECDPLLKPKSNKPWETFEYKMDHSRYGK